MIGETKMFEEIDIQKYKEIINKFKLPREVANVSEAFALISRTHSDKPMPLDDFI